MHNTPSLLSPPIYHDSITISASQTRVMSTPLIFFHGDAEWRVTRPPSTAVQSLLEDSCAHFSLPPLDYQLELHQGRTTKPLDHSTNLRLSSLPHNAHLHLRHSPLRSLDVHVTVELASQGGLKLNHTFPLATSLHDVLSTLQSLNPSLHLTAHSGVPAPEVHERYSVHINVEGVMQPAVESGGRRIAGADDLARTTLASLGLRGEGGRAGKGRLRLTFDYAAPELSAERQSEVMGRFTQTFADSVAEVDRKVRERVERQRKDKEAAARVVIPPDRRRRLYRAPAGLLPSPELPDSFYDVTEEDSVEYARSIQQQAANERSPPSTPPTRPPLPHLSVVRVRLPSHLYLEGLFHSSEPQDAVAQWVTECLREGQRGRWEVVVSPPPRVVKGQRTLRQDGLVGSVLLWLRNREDSGVRRGRESALREETKDGELDEKKEEVKRQDVCPLAEEKVADVREALSGEQLLVDEALATLVALPAPASHSHDVSTPVGSSEAVASAAG